MQNVLSKSNKSNNLKESLINVPRETIKNPNPYKLLPKNWSINISKESLTIAEEVNGQQIKFNLINQIKLMDYQTLLKTREFYVENNMQPYSNQGFYDIYQKLHIKKFGVKFRPVLY